MVKQIIWPPLAQSKRKEILNYWIQNNKSNTYSIKLNTLFKNAVKLIAIYPNIGRKTDLQNVRIKVVNSYQIFYEVKVDSFIILTIWDSRQNPDRLILV